MAILLVLASIVFISLSCAVGLIFAALLRRIRQSETTFRNIAECASDGLLLMEEDSRIVWANPAYCRIMGYALHEVLGRYPLEFVLPPELAISTEKARSFRFDPKDERFGKLTRVRNVRKDGSEFMHEFSHAVVPSPGTGRDRYLLIGRDISVNVAFEQELIEAREQMAVQARSDPLTGLANRIHLGTTMQELMTSGTPFTVLQVDLDDFKDVNDTYGHHAGDMVLRQVARILNAHVGHAGLAARVGGDEFTLLVSGETSIDLVRKSAEELSDALHLALSWTNGEIPIGASIGIAAWEPGSMTADAVLNRADVALYAAKASNGPRVSFYDDDMHSRYEQEQRLSRELTVALKTGGIGFHLQPVVELPSGRVTRFEMLVRWLHPTLGLLSPSEFLPLVARQGLERDLDTRVVDDAFEVLDRLDGAGLGDIAVAVNLTVDALAGSDITDRLSWAVDSGRLDPARLIVEVLETIALPGSGDNSTTRNVARLAAAGFPMCLDDFGMGHAGLAHLAGLDVAAIKIDRELVSRIDHDPKAVRIVTALLWLCEGLGIEVVAEGVETQAQIDAVLAAGGQLFQGYAIAKPMPVEDAIAWAVAARLGDARARDRA